MPDGMLLGAVSLQEALTCVILSAVLTGVGAALFLWEIVRWRKLRAGSGLSEAEVRHNYWRMVRRTAISLLLVVGGPLLALGWLRIDEQEHRKAFVVFWTVVNAAALALILLAVLDALIVLRFGLKESARLREERVDALAEIVRSRRRFRADGSGSKRTDIAERN